MQGYAQASLSGAGKAQLGADLRKSSVKMLRQLAGEGENFFGAEA